MKEKKHIIFCFFPILILILSACSANKGTDKISVNDQEYLFKPGLSVLSFHNYYPGGKQGGIEIIQHGERIATNGFIRMQEVDGKRFPDPLKADRKVDKQSQMIKSEVSYDDFGFKYTVRIWPEGNSVMLAVDLDKPIPENWKKKLSFGMEFFPPLYYGKTFQIGNSFGIVPRLFSGDKLKDESGVFSPEPMGTGAILTLAGEDPMRKVVVESSSGDLVLTDDRNSYYGGWISVKTEIPSGMTQNAIIWKITPNTIPGWKKDPMIAVSQVGYHPDQVKKAILELDPQNGSLEKMKLLKVDVSGGLKEVFSAIPLKWGRFLCYDYAVFDFSSVKDPGMFVLNYSGIFSNPFSINKDIYSKNVWQPTLEGYFPIQMCHLKVRDRSLIWHGACHLDDALQAPPNTIHVDQYRQYEGTETKYPVQTTVPFLNQGGWHDAGDDDLAAGSQAGTTHYLVLAYELNKDQTDQTSVNFEDRYVEMYKPDGIPDFVQQIKQGALNLVSGYRASGHSFAGIIANREGRNITGDWASQTDQLFYDSKLGPRQKTLTHSGINDDRWVFTNKDTGLEYKVLASLAAASRSLTGFDDKLAKECIETAEKVWDYEQAHEPVLKPAEYVPRNTKVQEVIATAELLFTTGKEKYSAHLVSMLPEIEKRIESTAWCVARVSDKIADEQFNSRFKSALQGYKVKLDSALSANPFGVNWRPAIWGIGWNIQEFALQQYYLIDKYPEIFDREQLLRVVNYVLGCHPGSNTSFVSGVGARSIMIAFGVNRTMEGNIPGGMVSGTALIRPDFPELKETTPYLWQQTEYVMSGAATYIFCVKAANKLLNNR